MVDIKPSPGSNKFEKLEFWDGVDVTLVLIFNETVPTLPQAARRKYMDAWRVSADPEARVLQATFRDVWNVLGGSDVAYAVATAIHEFYRASHLIDAAMKTELINRIQNGQAAVDP